MLMIYYKIIFGFYSHNNVIVIEISLMKILIHLKDILLYLF